MHVICGEKSKAFRNNQDTNAYQLMWEFLHKLRVVIGYRHGRYQLTEWVELNYDV